MNLKSNKNNINVIYISKYLLISLLVFLVILIICITIYNKLNIDTGNFNLINFENLDKNYNTINYSKYISTNNESLNNYLKEYDLKKYYTKKDIDFLKYQYKNKKLLAITFDDGPSKNTLKLLDILKEYHIPATFFVLGNKIEKNKDILKKEFNNGINDIGIHSYDHKILTKLNKKEIEKSINDTEKLIENITNKKHNLVRAPYGITNKNVNIILSNNNYINIKWNVDSLDWKYKEKNKTFNHIKKQIKGNDIILMHDIYIPSIEAANLTINYYLKEHYTFVTVSTLLKIKSIVEN